MPEQLHQLIQASPHEQMIRKSRFVAQASAVDSTEAALAWLHRVSEPGASHNCWAWRMGQEYRFQDDGEPSGSAGKPILAAIDGQQFDRIVVVVARWFGGIKLGVGGLVRAYGGCAASCLRNALREPLVDATKLEFACDLAVWPRLRARLAEFDAFVTAEDYFGTEVHLAVSLPIGHRAGFEQLLADLTRGRARIRAAD